MKVRVLGAVAALMFPAAVLAQSSRPATYITADQVKQVNALPGVDRQIVNVDVGNTNLAVGVVHRGKTGQPPAGGGGAAAGRGAPAAASPAPTPEPCGEKGTVPAGSPTGLWHQGQTETYLIISGSGTLVTGGGLVFAGWLDRTFTAHDTRTGTVLWKIRLNEVPSAPPVAFSARGQDYIAVVVGPGGYQSTSYSVLVPEIRNPSDRSAAIWVFEVPTASGPAVQP